MKQPQPWDCGGFGSIGETKLNNVSDSYLTRTYITQMDSIRNRKLPHLGKISLRANNLPNLNLTKPRSFGDA